MTRPWIRRAQGMTEYIVIVGLIAIVLISAVSSYKETVRTAIEGTDGNGGAAGGVNEANDAMVNRGGPGSTTPADAGYSEVGRTPDNRVIYSGPGGGQFVKSGADYVPYTP